MENLKLDNSKNKFETIFFLFLPQFQMETPFHYLLSKEKYHIFDSIAEQIDTKLFDEFLNHENNYLEKVKLMFIFILENVNSFYLDAIKNFYCSFVYSYDESDLDKSTLENVEKIEGYLQRINRHLNISNHPDLT